MRRWLILRRLRRDGQALRTTKRSGRCTRGRATPRPSRTTERPELRPPQLTTSKTSTGELFAEGSWCLVPHISPGSYAKYTSGTTVAGARLLQGREPAVQASACRGGAVHSQGRQASQSDSSAVKAPRRVQCCKPSMQADMPNQDCPMALLCRLAPSAHVQATSGLFNVSIVATTEPCARHARAEQCIDPTQHRHITDAAGSLAVKRTR